MMVDNEGLNTLSRRVSMNELEPDIKSTWYKLQSLPNINPKFRTWQQPWQGKYAPINNPMR